MYMEDDRDGDDAIRDLEGAATASVPCPRLLAPRAHRRLCLSPSAMPCSSDPVQWQRASLSESASPAIG